MMVPIVIASGSESHLSETCVQSNRIQIVVPLSPNAIASLHDLRQPRHCLKHKHNFEG